NNLGNRYSELGRKEEALKAAEGAVEIYGGLAKKKPEVYEPYLAGSLNNLGSIYSELGRKEEALKAYEQALRLRKKLKDFKTQFSIYPYLINATVKAGEIDYHALAEWVCAFLDLYEVFKENEGRMWCNGYFVKEGTFKEINFVTLLSRAENHVHCKDRLERFLGRITSLSAEPDKEALKESV
ncbi:MAG: tetratricopeptide repeat protein, partial [Nitrospirae bacterium]